MQQAATPLLSSWQSFYTIIGSAAAALTGLMFVVITLIMGTSRDRVRRSNNTIGAFGTPTVVHFCSALLVAAILSAPWPKLWQVAILLGLAGLSGVLYVLIITWRARRQDDYQPVLEDWLWHMIFPFIAYGGILIAALLLPFLPVPALFIIATAAVLFLFIGIHNSWDTVTYLAIQYSQPENESQE